MANPEKHKKNPIMEWLGDEETELGCQARAARVVGGGDKLSKAVARKPPVLVPPVAAKPDPALMRAAAPPHRLNERHSQASSPEHLRKLQRLPRLRAPIASKPSSPRPR